MILSLTDILTTQAVERPQNGNSYRSARSDDSASFKDYLNKPEADFPTKNKPEREIKRVFNEVINDIKPNNGFNRQADDNSSVPENNTSYISNGSTNAPDAKVENGNQVQSDIQSISPEKKAKLTELYNSIKKFQASGVSISDADAKKLNEVLAQLQVNGISGPVVNSENVVDAALPVNNIAETISDNLTGQNADNKPVANNAVVDVLNKMDFAGLTSLYNSIKQVQASGSNLSEGDKQKLNDVLAKLAEKGISDTQNPGDKISGNEISANDVVEDILNKMNSADTDKLPQTVDQLVQQVAAAQQVAGSDIGKIASKVIEVAKDEANKPQIPASNLRSLQVASLSNLGKKEDKDKNNTGSGASLDFTNSDFSDVNQQDVVENIVDKNPAEKIQSLLSNSKDVLDQKKLDDTLVYSRDATSLSNTQATQQQNTTINNVSINDSVKQVVGQQPGKDISNAGKIEDVNLGTNQMTSENFVKFQKMMEDAQSLTKHNSASRMQNADEVIAQIKFGMNGGISKDERNISIQLHPKELGKVDISMQMGHDGKTHITVIAERTDTLNMLQKESSSLRDMLSDALKTDSGNLNFSFQEKGGDDWKQQFSNSNSSNGNRINTPAMVGAEYLTAQSYRYNMIATEGLDIRV